MALSRQRRWPQPRPVARRSARIDSRIVRRRSPSEANMANPYLSYLKEQFWPRAAGRDVWMIVDGSRDRQVYGMLLDSYLTYSCLYHGDLAPELELAAPYLVQLEYDEKYSDRLIERARGNSWGVFLKCDSSISSLRRHLRKLLTVRGPKGEILLFRYYDP